MRRRGKRKTKNKKKQKVYKRGGIMSEEICNRASFEGSGMVKRIS